MIWRGLESLLVVSDYYLPTSIRIILGIIMGILEFIITIALGEEDIEHIIKSRREARK